MSKKTVKDLDSEFTQFRVDFTNLQVKFNELSKKHEALEKKYSEVIFKENFQCKNCDATFRTMTDLRKHRKVHKTDRYSCENCDKTFVNEDTMEMHNTITHKNVRFYCHYFNNGKQCPFKTECVFLHEVSKVCKDGKKCERDMCMFRHEVQDDIEINPEKINVNEECVSELVEKNDATADQSDFVDVDEVDETKAGNEISNRTFNNPSQVENITSDELFKCEICDFASARQKIIEDHKELFHNWCPRCYSSFDSQRKLKSHVKNDHSDK